MSYYKFKYNFFINKFLPLMDRYRAGTGPLTYNCYSAGIGPVLVQYCENFCRYWTSTGPLTYNCYCAGIGPVLDRYCEFFLILSWYWSDNGPIPAQQTVWTFIRRYWASNGPLTPCLLGIDLYTVYYIFLDHRVIENSLFLFFLFNYIYFFIFLFLYFFLEYFFVLKQRDNKYNLQKKKIYC